MPFSPTVTARSLTGPDLADPDGAPVAASSFDRPLPGTYTGHVDLTITALTPLFVGGDPHGEPFRWPGTTPGVAGIPGSSLHGMLRGTLAHVLGGGIGPVPDRTIYYRSPIAPETGTRDPVHDTYKRRNLGGLMGRQRIGLLYRAAEGDFRIDECVQFTLTNRDGRPIARAAPRVRRAVLEADLGLRWEGSRPGRPPADVRNHQWRRIWVVWAAVGRGAGSRPVVAGIGSSPAAAAAKATARRDDNRIRQCLPPDNASTFRHFLMPDGTATNAPHPTEMVFCATGLEGLPTIASAYLFPIPGSDVEELIDPELRFADVTRESRPVSRAVVGRLYDNDQVTRYQRDNWPGPRFLTLAQDGPDRSDGMPVFFSTDDKDIVTHLGRSGGFRIPAARTVLDTVPAEYRIPGPEVPALHALFGHQPVESRDGVGRDTVPGMAGRIEVGHARAVAEPGTLRTVDVALLEPKVAAWKFRLERRSGQLTTGYEDPDAVYRGREVYHHRWPRGEVDDATQWNRVTGERPEPDPTDTEARAETPDERISGPKTPLRSGTRFAARVRFTNLAPAELGALLFAIRLGNTGDGDGLSRDFAHKIGGMKPLGLGSVHLDGRAEVVPADRHQTWDAPATVPLEDEGACVRAFLDVVGAAEGQLRAGWVRVPETGRHWPEHVAALLLSARWARRPELADVQEMSLEDHKHSTNLPDVFALHPDATRHRG